MVLSHLLRPLAIDLPVPQLNHTLGNSSYFPRVDEGKPLCGGGSTWCCVVMWNYCLDPYDSEHLMVVHQENDTFT
jgi:hypothetical protein